MFGLGVAAAGQFMHSFGHDEQCKGWCARLSLIAVDVEVCVGLKAVEECKDVAERVDLEEGQGRIDDVQIKVAGCLQG